MLIFSVTSTYTIMTVTKLRRRGAGARHRHILRPRGLPLMQHHAEMRKYVSHSCHYRGTRNNWQYSYLDGGSEIVIPKVGDKEKGSTGGYCG